MAVPERRRVTLDLLLNIKLKIKISSPEIKPPAKAKILTGDKNFKNIVVGKGIKLHKTTARVAPEEIPRIPESARGFRKKPCKTAPHPLNSIPHKTERHMRGSLISKRIILSNLEKPDCEK